MILFWKKEGDSAPVPVKVVLKDWSGDGTMTFRPKKVLSQKGVFMAWQDENGIEASDTLYQAIDKMLLGIKL